MSTPVASRMPSRFPRGTRLEELMVGTASDHGVERDGERTLQTPSILDGRFVADQVPVHGNVAFDHAYLGLWTIPCPVVAELDGPSPMPPWPRTQVVVEVGRLHDENVLPSVRVNRPSAA